MHSAIVAVKMPDKGMDWQTFTSVLETKVKRGPHVQRLSENVWLVNFQEAPTIFAWLISMCDRHGFEYGILPLDAVPQWLPVGFDPNTI